MTATATARPTPAATNGARPVVVAALVVAAVAMATESRWVRLQEAITQAALLPALGVDTDRIGTSVLFVLDGELVGFTVAVGCSVAYMLPPFYLLIAALLAVGRIDSRRALWSAVWLTALIATVNQLRFLVIAGSMHWWGFETGFERSHIFLGTMVSTVGVVAGLLLVLNELVRPPRRSGSTGG